MAKMILALICISFMPAWCNAENLSPPISGSLQLKVMLIAIDPGFGGDKTGPSGSCGKVYAKDINLQIAKKLEDRIKKDLGINAILTRDSDVDISSEERCSSANINEADIFISISCNGSENASASGIETYFLNLETEPDAIRTAAGQNAANSKSIADMKTILTELLQNVKARESTHLAESVQSHLYTQIKSHNKVIKNRGTKRAPFYVLLGTKMPAIMVTPGFVTNPIECNLLSSEGYQDDISMGIVDGIRAYMKERSTQQSPPAPL